MSEPSSTSVAVRPSDSVGVLPPQIRAALELRKAQNIVAAKLAQMNWGENLDLTTRRAVADWGQSYGVDVTTEVHVLGNNIYLNAKYYLRRLAELIKAGGVEYAVADHVEFDKRLVDLGEEGEAEAKRRLLERINYQIPDAAVSAVVFRVKLRSLTQEITGAKWCGDRGVNKYGKQNDPIGKEFPVETCESRAARRAMRLLASHVPSFGAGIGEIEEAAEVVSGQIVAAKTEAGPEPIPHLPAPIGQGTHEDPYANPVTDSAQEPML